MEKCLCNKVEKQDRLWELEPRLYEGKPGRIWVKLLTVVLNRVTFPVLQASFFPERPVITLKEEITLVFM